MKRITTGTLALAAVSAGVVWTVDRAPAQQKELVIGEQCDRTGATQIVGVNLCPGVMDYIDLINSKGGVEGYRIKLAEIDHEYKVPPAIEAYERHKAEGAVSLGALICLHAGRNLVFMVDLVGPDLEPLDPAFRVDEVDVVLDRRAQADADDLCRAGAVALLADQDFALLLRQARLGERHHRRRARRQPD